MVWLEAGGANCRQEWAAGLFYEEPTLNCYPEDEGFFRRLRLSEPESGMNKLIFANLLHRPVRSIISVLAVAIEVVMILSIVAIFMGMLDDQKNRINGIGADLVVALERQLHEWCERRAHVCQVGRLSAPACRMWPWPRR